MVDYSMCSGEGCNRKEQCYRYRAQPNENWQSWFATPPIKKDGTCEEFLPAKDWGIT